MTESAIPLPKKILKNFLSLSSGEVIAKALSFFAVAYLARVLKAEGFGTLGFANAVLFFFVFFVHTGIDTFGIREVARDVTGIKVYVNNIITVKLLFSFFAYACLIIFVYFIPQPIQVKKILLIYGLTLFTYTFTLNWVFLGMERMHLIAFCGIIIQLVYASGVFLFIKNQNQILHVPVIQISAEVITLLVYFTVFFKSFGLIRFRLDIPFCKRICVESLPIAFSAIMMGINYNFDLVMLGFIKGREAVGWYNAAYKVVLLILTMVTLYHVCLFPAISQCYKRKKSDIAGLVRNSLRVTTIFALPIGIGGTILAAPIMDIIYGDQYKNGIIPFQLLIWAIVIMIIRANYKITLIAFDRQKDYMMTAIYAALINIILNLILIPRFSLIGAAIATLCAEAVFLIMVYVNMSESVVRIPFLNHLVKPTISAIVMGLALYLSFFTKDINLFMTLFIGMCTYFLALILLKGISLQEIEVFYRK